MAMDRADGGECLAECRMWCDGWLRLSVRMRERRQLGLSKCHAFWSGRHLEIVVATANENVERKLTAEGRDNLLQCANAHVASTLAFRVGRLAHTKPFCNVCLCNSNLLPGVHPRAS